MNGRQIRRSCVVAAGLVVIAVAILAVAVLVAPSRAGSIPTQTAVVASPDRKVSAAGRVAAVRDSLVYSGVQGTIARVNVADQERVKKGDVLVALDAEPYRVEKAQALAQTQQARATLDSLDGVSGVSAQRRAARSALASARRTYRLADRNIERAVIRAPFAGTVFLLPNSSGQTSPRLERGQGVTSQAPLLRLVDLNRLKFVADIDQDDVQLVAEGQLAHCSLDSSATQTLDGSVTYVSLVSRTTASGLVAFSAESSLPTAARGLRPGMEGTVSIAVGGASSGVSVPQAAITRRDGQPAVFVVENGVAHMRRVSLGPSLGAETRVTSGLKLGDVVATSGVDTLSDGADVSAE